MAIERTDLMETDEQKQAREQEHEKLREESHKNELARVKAEAELAGLRQSVELLRVPQGQPQVQQVTEEQWAALEAQTGQTRAAIIANQQLAFQQVQASEGKIDAKLKALQDKIEKTEARNAELEQRHSLESAQDKFYEGKPALKAYKKEVSEFLGMFPESEKSDPEKFGKIMEKAEVYVKGLVGNKMRNQNSGNSGSARLGSDSSFEESEGSDKIDFTGLESVGERRLVADIHTEFSGRKDKDLLDKYASSDKMGVRYDSSDEFAQGDSMLRGTAK